MTSGLRSKMMTGSIAYERTMRRPRWMTWIERCVTTRPSSRVTPLRYPRLILIAYGTLDFRTGPSAMQHRQSPTSTT